MRRLLLVPVGLVAALGGCAGGTAALVAAEPGDGARLRSPPPAVTLTFTGDLDPGQTHVVVVGPDGSPVSVGEPVLAGDTLVQEVAVAGEGLVVIGYHAVVIGDGEVSGQLRFTVGSGPGGPGAPPAPEPPASDGGGGHGHGELGWLATAAVLVMLLAGGALLVLMIRPRRT